MDGAEWNDVAAFLTALRSAIGAPDWHGWGPDAFVDSMTWGGINALEPPYTIVVKGLEHAPEAVGSYVDLVSNALWLADNDHLNRTGARTNARMVRHTLLQTANSTETLA